MSKLELPDVRVGDVWRDNDPRFRDTPRMLVVQSVGGGVAVCRSSTNRTAAIKLARFRPTSTGYLLVERGGIRVGDFRRCPPRESLMLVRALDGDLALLDNEQWVAISDLAKMPLVSRDGKPVEA